MAQTADMAASRFGIPYFTAAGNDRGYSWQLPNGFEGIVFQANGTNITLYQFGMDSNGQPVFFQNILIPYLSPDPTMVL